FPYGHAAKRRTRSFTREDFLLPSGPRMEIHGTDGRNRSLNSPITKATERWMVRTGDLRQARHQTARRSDRVHSAEISACPSTAACHKRSPNVFPATSINVCRNALP